MMGIEKKSQGCLFALSNMIYGWKPGMNTSRFLARRPAPVSAICQGRKIYGRKSDSLVDACYDGAVRIGLSDLAEVKFDQPVVGVMYFYQDYLDPAYRQRRKIERHYMAAPDQSVLLYVLAGESSPKHGCREFEYKDSLGRNHGCMTPPYDDGTINFIATEREIYWSCCNGATYRGFGDDTIDVRFPGSHIQLMPFEGNFFIAHCYNDSIYPEGYLISGRDCRTILTFDYDEFCLPQVIGMYEWSGKPQLFFVGLGRGGDKEDLIVGYTMPFRAEGGRIPCPQLCFTMPRGESGIAWPYNNENPFCAVDLEDYSHLFE